MYFMCCTELNSKLTNKAFADKRSYLPRNRNLPALSLHDSTIGLNNILGYNELKRTSMTLKNPINCSVSVCVAMAKLIVSCTRCGVCSTVAVFVLCSSILSEIGVPLPTWSKSRRLHSKRYPLFRLFPVCQLILMFLPTVMPSEKNNIWLKSHRIVETTVLGPRST